MTPDRCNECRDKDNCRMHKLLKEQQAEIKRLKDEKEQATRDIENFRKELFYD